MKKKGEMIIEKMGRTEHNLVSIQSERSIVIFNLEKEGRQKYILEAVL